MVDPNRVNSLIERFNRPWMVGALNYKNNRRGPTGKEDFKTKWFDDLNGINWSKPFFRHVDGKDHTHFFIDVDVKIVTRSIKKQYEQYPDKLREMKLEAVVEFFRKWQLDYANHKFFWKISATGLHAVQRINRRIDRSRLIPIILFLFPPTSRIKVEISTPKNHIHVKPLSSGKNAIPNVNDNGWCLDYNIKERKYNELNWVKLWKYKDVIYKFVIDLNFYFNNTRIVRWTYSPCFNIPGRIYYSTPITRWHPQTVINESVFENLVVKKYTIPEFSFKHMIDWEDTVEDELWIQRKARTVGEGKAIIAPYQIHLYDVNEDIPTSYNNKLTQISNFFLKGIEKTPSCIRAHYERTLTKGAGGHWSRFQTGRYLRAFNYSIEDIANWYRFKINDEEDNSVENRHLLLTYLPPVLGAEEDPHKVASCGVMQDPGSPYYICDEKMQNICGRRHPLAKRPIKDKRKPVAEVDRPPQFRGEKERKTYWTEIKNLMRKAFNKEKNLVVWKATRAGVTTTMIRIAAEAGKKLLVVVPTNKIGEVTFPDAMRIVKEDMGEVVNGAILASNRRGCLLLNFVEKGLDNMKKLSPEWGDKGVAWTRLRYHSRPDCSRCTYNQSVINTPILDKDGNPEPLNRSEILNYDRRTGYCAYITFRDRVENFDVVFITYAKLFSLMISGSEDSEDLRDDLYGYFDIILLDEVSTFANRSPIDLTILKHPNLMNRLDETAKIDIFAQLRKEVEDLSSFTTSRTAHDMIGYCNRFISYFEYLKLKKWDEKEPTITLIQEGTNPELEVIKHPLNYFHRQELRTEFNKIHGILDNYSRIENKTLSTMEDILLLLCEDSWVAVNTPTPTRSLELRFISAPKTAEVKAFIRRFGRPNNNKYVFATDACMPEVNLSEFFDLDLEDFLVGDPRHTNENQLLIADTRNLGVIRFSTPMKCIESECLYSQHEECTLEHRFVGKDPKNNYKITNRRLKAFYNGVCYKYQIEFLKECNAIVRMYGTENVMVVLPNKDVYFWFLEKIVWGAIPRGVEITYYRSDKTLGVPCDKRIMMCLGMPYTPKGSHLWLAHYYQHDNLLTQYRMWDLAEKLRLNSCKQAFWQTIGRAKSPVGKTRSVVIAWGISRKGMNLLFDFNRDYMRDSLPHVFIPHKRGHDERVNYIIGRFWRTYGAIPDPALMRLSQLVQEARWIGKWIKHSELKRHGGVSQDEIERLAVMYDDEMFGHLGIEVKISKWGAFTKLDARSTTTSDQITL